MDVPNTIKVMDCDGLRWSLPPAGLDNLESKPVNNNIRYSDVINFPRSSKLHLCVMCGQVGNIPSQNKDVCKSCDTVYWYHQKLDVVVKFCKGFKNFVTLSEFQEKPEASKCGKFRHRGRLNYFGRKRTNKNSNASPFTTSSEDDSDASVDDTEIIN